jgi:hypothetical protein
VSFWADSVIVAIDLSGAEAFTELKLNKATMEAAILFSQFF